MPCFDQLSTKQKLTRCYGFCILILLSVFDFKNSKNNSLTKMRKKSLRIVAL